MKKKIVLSTLITLGLSLTFLIISAIASAFSESSPKVLWKITGVLACLFLFCLFSLNFKDELAKKNKLAIIAVSMLGLSVIILIIMVIDSNIISKGEMAELKSRICWSIVITTIFVNLLFNPILKLNNKFKGMQITIFSLLIICYIQFMLWVIFTNNQPIHDYFNSKIPIFTLFVPCVVIAGLEIVANIFKNKDEKKPVEDNIVKITVEEYDVLLKQIEDLKEEIKQLKQD